MHQEQNLRVVARAHRKRRAGTHLQQLEVRQHTHMTLNELQAVDLRFTGPLLYPCVSAACPYPLRPPRT